MTPQLAAEFIYQALVNDTGTGRINDPDAGTNPSGVASFVTARVSSYFRNPSVSPETLPNVVIKIEQFEGIDSQSGGGEPLVTAAITVYDETAQTGNRLVKICNELTGNAPTASGGVSTYGVVRCGLGPSRNGTLTDSTFNPLNLKATNTYLDSIEQPDFADGSTDKIAVTYRIKFNLTTP